VQGSYTVGLGFKVLCGVPNWKIECDTWFDGSFGPTSGVNTILVKDYGTAPNVQGNKDYVINVPAAQPNGDYYMAIRVTDGDTPPSQWIYMWPDRVTLGPQN
jgi:hypothetical protein